MVETILPVAMLGAFAVTSAVVTYILSRKPHVRRPNTRQYPSDHFDD